MADNSTPRRAKRAASQGSKSGSTKGKKPSKKGTKKGAKKQKSTARKVLGRIGIGLTILVLVLALAGVGAFMYLYSTTDLPDPHAEFQTETTFLYYNDGESQLGSLAVQNREVLTYEEIPEVVKDAVIAAENRSFWEDPGFSVSGILRSMWSIATGGEVQGGSTITQQYIKILYLDSERTVNRKVRELILATKMGREMPKEEILTGYLNTIYFGRGAYGVQAASKSFFLKPASELSLDEAAVLATILNNPSRFNPSDPDSHDRLLERYRYVLSGMLEMGKIDQAEYDRASQQLPEFPEVPINERYGGPKGFLIHKAEQELQALGFSEAEVHGGGLRITTTIDERMQQAAVETAQEYTEKAATEANEPQDPEDLHIAISSVDTGTGAILSMYGGPDFTENSRNWATTPRPAASTFKAFATVAALRNGYNLDSVFNGNSFTPDGDPKPVNNQGQQNYGDVSLRRALALSINTAFVDLTVDMPNGSEEIIKAAEDAGAPKAGGWDPNTRIALGAAEVSPVNMANAYATLVNRGTYNSPHIIAKVTDREGRVLYEAPTEGEDRIDSNVAANVVEALTDVVNDGTGARATELGRPVAGKTGTNGVEDKITSAWFIGATRQISTAVMYVAGDGGNDDIIPFKRPEDRTFYGSGYPLSTWLDYMKVATEGQEVLDFDPARPIESEERQQTEEPSPEPTTQAPTTEEPTPEETSTPEETPTPEETTTPEETPTEEETPTDDPTTPEETTPPPDDESPPPGEGQGNPGPGQESAAPPGQG